MRIISLIVAIIIALFLLTGNAEASNESDTDTNTKISFSSIKNFFFPSAALADEKVAEAPEVAVVQEEAPKTEEELKNEAILLKWKEKQADKWVNLPEGKFTINASAYTAAADETGGSGKGITSSGIKVQEKRTLACPPNFPFGAKINIEGYGTFVCEDRGGAIKGNKVDIYMQTKAEAFKFGRRNLIAEVVK